MGLPLLQHLLSPGRAPCGGTKVDMLLYSGGQQIVIAAILWLTERQDLKDEEISG